MPFGGRFGIDTVARCHIPVVPPLGIVLGMTLRMVLFLHVRGAADLNRGGVASKLAKLALLRAELPYVREEVGRFQNLNASRHNVFKRHTGARANPPVELEFREAEIQSRAARTTSPAQRTCEKMTDAIVMDGGRRGQTVKVCADSACRIHHGNRPSPQKVARQRAEERKRIEKEKLAITVRHRILGWPFERNSRMFCRLRPS